MILGSQVILDRPTSSGYPDISMSVEIPFCDCWTLNGSIWMKLQMISWITRKELVNGGNLGQIGPK